MIVRAYLISRMTSIPRWRGQIFPKKDFWVNLPFARLAAEKFVPILSTLCPVFH